MGGPGTGEVAVVPPMTGMYDHNIQHVEDISDEQMRHILLTVKENKKFRKRVSNFLRGRKIDKVFTGVVYDDEYDDALADGLVVDVPQIPMGNVLERRPIAALEERAAMPTSTGSGLVRGGMFRRVAWAREVTPMNQGQTLTVPPSEGNDRFGSIQNVVMVSDEELEAIYDDLRAGHRFLGVYSDIAYEPEVDDDEAAYAQPVLTASVQPPRVSTRRVAPAPLSGGARSNRVAPLEHNNAAEREFFNWLAEQQRVRRAAYLEPGQDARARSLGPTHGEVAPYDEGDWDDPNQEEIRDAEWELILAHEFAQKFPSVAAVETRPATNA